MTNDIEAAARRALLFLEVAYTAPIFPNTGNPVRLREVAGVPSIIDALRSALAHATRGEGVPPPWHAPCVLCGHRQSAHNTDTGPCSKCGCDCAAFRPTPPPATGEAAFSKTYAGFLRPMLDDVERTTGEAGTRGEVIRWISCPNGDHFDERASTFFDEADAAHHADSANSDAPEGESWGVIPLYALPEAREGKS